MAVCGTLLVALALASLTQPVHSAVIPPSAHSEAESELSSLTQEQQSLSVSGAAVERTVQSAKVRPDWNEKTVQDIVQDEQKVDMGEDSAERGEWESLNILHHTLQEGKNKVARPEDWESDDTDEDLPVLEQPEIIPQDKLLHDDESDEKELLDLKEERDQSDGDYKQVLQVADRMGDYGPDPGPHAEDSVAQTSEDGSLSSEEYDGFGSDDTNEEEWIEVSDANKLADDLADDLADLGSDGLAGGGTQGPRSRTPASSFNTDQFHQVRPYLDDAIAKIGSDHAVHDDVKRGQDFVQVPGFPPLRVIELNETIYINNTDDSTQPKFQPVPMPERFEDYDVNKDGLISLPELRYVTGAIEGAKQAFRDTDTDGDGWVEREEFRKAGWGVPVDSATPLPAQSSAVFIPRENTRPSGIPRENTRPSGIPRAADDVRSRRPLTRPPQ